MGSLVSVGGILANLIAYRLMMGSLIKRLFHFRPKFASESKKKKQKPGPKKRSDSIVNSASKLEKIYKAKLIFDGIKEDPLIAKERATIHSLIENNKAKFKYKTKSILATFFCMRIMFPRPCLRKHKHLRGDLYYRIGIEHLNKELDIANMLTKIRTLNFFMKMVLDTDQRKLLKYRSSKLLDSGEE